MSLKANLLLLQPREDYAQGLPRLTLSGQDTYLFCPGDRVRVSLHQLLGCDCLRFGRTGDLEEQRNSACLVPGDSMRWNSSLYRSFHLTGMCQGWFGCCTAAMRAIQSVVKGPAGTQGITSLRLPRCHQGSHPDPVSPSALLLGQNTSFSSTVEWEAPLPFPSILGPATHSNKGEGCTFNATHTWRYITVSSFRDYCNNCAVWPMNTAEKNRFLLESDCLISCSKAASASIKHVCNSPSTFSESIWSLNKHSLMLEQAWCLKK